MWNEIDQRIKRAVHHLEKRFMSTVKDIADNLSGIASDFTVVAGGVASLNTTLADVQAKLAAALAAQGTTVPADVQAAIDNAVTQSAGIKQSMDALAAGFAATASAASAAAAPAPAAPAPSAPAAQ